MRHDRGMWVWALMMVTQYDLHVIAIGMKSIQQYSSEVFRVNLGENESEASPTSHESLYDQFDESHRICLSFHKTVPRYAHLTEPITTDNSANIAMPKLCLTPCTSQLN